MFEQQLFIENIRKYTIQGFDIFWDTNQFF